jgi:hypothetical protein
VTSVNVPTAFQQDPLLIEQAMPEADEEIARHRIIDASPERVMAAARNLDFMEVRSRLVDAAMFARGLPARLRRHPVPDPPSMRLSDAVEAGEMQLPGWLIIGEKEGREIAFGAVGRFWKPDIEWRDVSPEDFAGFDEPGWGKIAADFSVTPYGDHRTLLTYACRVRCTDADSRRRFGRYWWLVSPFVGHIFAATLDTIAREVAAPEVVDAVH